ncbi:hypothetical protein BGZ90_002652 [Linnemannia elongata]|nr:hypothetical protein BGZ90_002652 [Linnemannia elongata]
MSGTTTTTTTTRTNPLTLPELLLSLGPFLSLQDLYSSIQVNHLWNTLLVPFLWYSIDDRLFSWPTILNRIHCDELDNNPNTLQVLFEKYGHHIHHLSLSCLTTLQAASAATTCTQLRSLLVFGLKDRDPPLPNQEPEEANSNLHRHPNQQSSLGPLLSPMFERVFRPSQEVWDNPIKQRQYWRMVQLYWILVHHNNKHLQNLHLEAEVGRLFRMVSKEYLFYSLSLLKNLRSIDTGLVQMDFPVLLDRVLSLHTLRSRLSDPFTKETVFSKTIPQQPFFQLRLLELRDRLYLQEFYLLLRYLPQLDDIVFAGFMMQAGLLPSPQDIMDNKPSQLQGLHLRQIGKQDDKIIPEVLQWLPYLKRFGIALLYPSIAKALRMHCPDLESFSDSGAAEDGHEQEGGVVVVIPPGVPISSANTLNHLLQHCSKLRTVRARRHTIMGSYAVKHSWACRRIETLCFRLVGVSEDTLVVKRSTTTTSRTSSRAELSSNGSTSSTSEAESGGVASKEAQCRELHRRIKERLRELRCLRAVDLGEEWAEATTMVSDD